MRQCAFCVSTKSLEKIYSMKIAVVSANTPSHKGIRGDLIKAFIERGHEVVAFGGSLKRNGKRFSARGDMLIASSL